MSNAEKKQFDIDYDKCQEILSQNGDDKHRGNSDIVSAMMEYARLKSQ